MKVRANTDLETFLAVLDSFREHVRWLRPTELGYWVHVFDNIFEQYANNDGFGDERQEDPRGDGRVSGSKKAWGQLLAKYSKEIL